MHTQAHSRRSCHARSTHLLRGHCTSTAVHRTFARCITRNHIAARVRRIVIVAHMHSSHASSSHQPIVMSASSPTQAQAQHAQLHDQLQSQHAQLQSQHAQLQSLRAQLQSLHASTAQHTGSSSSRPLINVTADDSMHAPVASSASGISAEQMSAHASSASSSASSERKGKKRARATSDETYEDARKALEHHARFRQVFVPALKKAASKGWVGLVALLARKGYLAMPDKATSMDLYQFVQMYGLQMDFSSLSQVVDMLKLQSSRSWFSDEEFKDLVNVFNAAHSDTASSDQFGVMAQAFLTAHCTLSDDESPLSGSDYE